MKNVIKTLVALAVFNSVAANAAEEDATTSFSIGGTIESTCTVTSTQAVGITDLDLTSASSQSLGSINVWCNNGETSTTTYQSENGGVLQTASDDEIAYKLVLGGETVEFDASGAASLNPTTAGTGTGGTTASTTVNVIPEVTGLEAAGNYTDTITVTVTAN